MCIRDRTASLPRCAVAPRNEATPGTGKPAAAANYVMSLDAMASLAGALGDTANATKYANLAATMRSKFASRSIRNTVCHVLIFLCIFWALLLTH